MSPSPDSPDDGASGGIDIFIPTCLADLEQAAVLLASLEARLSDGVAASITIAAIDAANAFPAICALRTGRFQARTRYLHLGDLGLKDIAGLGWLAQQAAKLAFARIARTAHYLVLDSKNIALKPVRLADLVNAGRAAWVLEDASNHSTWWRGSSWALSHRNFDMQPGRQALSAATPVVFDTACVIDMLDWIERHRGYRIDDFFRHRFMRLDRSLIRRLLFRTGLMEPKEFTEFMMYYVFMDRERLCDARHFISASLHEVSSMIWQDTHPEERRERLERILDGRTNGIFVGIQRKAWQEISNADKSRIRELAAKGQ